MRAAVIENANPRPLGAPADWTPENGHCGGLFVRPEVINGVPFLRSAWEVEPDETGLLLAGGKMILGVAGDRHPVVHFQVGQMPDQFEPVTTVRMIVDMQGNSGVQVDMVFCHEGGKRGVAQCAMDGRTYAEAVADAIDKIAVLARDNGWVHEGWGKR